MKESITKFDLEAAFKALDEIDVPQVAGLKARRAPLQEMFSNRKTKTEMLIEEYYDVGDTADMDAAQKAREAEIAAAKLARIEKIVDLDAKTPEELLTSYVGKFIMQCPQCMTLFYKNKEDIEESEDDPTVVNVNEVCQHCGNESGYTLVGKVGAAEDETPDVAVEETSDEGALEDVVADEGIDLDVTETDDEGAETTDEEDINLDELEDLTIEDEEEEETTEESFNVGSGAPLLESSWTTVSDHRLDGFKDAVLDQLVSDGYFEEAKLFSRLNVQAVDPEYGQAFAHSPAALDHLSNPTALFVGPQLLDTSYDQAARAVRPILLAALYGEAIPADSDAQTAMEIAADNQADIDRRMTESLTEAKATLDLDVSDSEFDELLNSPSFQTPMTDKVAQAMLNKMAEDLQEEVDVNQINWLNIEGFTHLILESFEDEGVTGYEVMYSKNDIDLVTVEVWGEQDPVTVVENLYADNMMQSHYDTFADFAADLDYKFDQYLQEGIFDKIKKFGEKAKGLGIKILDKLKTREEKANWIIAHAAVDPNKLEATEQGDYVPQENNKRFKHFAVMGFKNTNADGAVITMAPEFNDKKLVPGLKRCETREKYEDADKLAKGWSAQAGKGPGFIYMSEDAESKKLVFLCQYFNGELVKSNDQLEAYFKLARKEFEGSKAIAKAGGFKQQGDEPAKGTPDLEETDTDADTGADTEE